MSSLYFLLKINKKMGKKTTQKNKKEKKTQHKTDDGFCFFDFFFFFQRREDGMPSAPRIFVPLRFLLPTTCSLPEAPQTWGYMCQTPRP